MVLHTQPGCPQCRAVHMLLDSKKIAYSENQDISKMQKLGIKHTPALEVDGQILQGKEIFNYIKRLG